MSSYAGPVPQIVIDAGTEMDRQQVEAIVRETLRDRPQSEPWAVILHELRPGWSVFIDGPDQDLCAEIKARLATAGYAPIPGPCPQ
ncbi:MAG: hypothetical protein DMF80_08220 [Acidobacteria bacterium]|nr:MAG: hypothetical protein DMF80_08220 [Acidobacteriota bacterium]PYQ21204.1 MAG: hypothetical protein DMF81_16185 [Acidobacteriota bacterium]